MSKNRFTNITTGQNADTIVVGHRVESVRGAWLRRLRVAAVLVASHGAVAGLVAVVVVVA